MFLTPLALRLAVALVPVRLGVIAITLTITIVAVASYFRWKAIRLFLAYSVLLPVVGTVAFIHGVPLSTDSAEAADVAPTSRVPIVLVVFDEFPLASLLTRGGNIDSLRYPSFGELARTATWYSEASGVHEHTTYAVPSIFTGRMPRRGQLPLLADHPENVFTLLAKRYSFHFQETVTHLCPTQFCQRERTRLWTKMGGLFSDVGIVYLHDLLPDGAAWGLPSIDQRWGSFLQQGRLQAAESPKQVLDVFHDGLIFPGQAEYERFLSSLSKRSSTATMYGIHLLQPHAPWSFLPSGQQYGFGETIDGTRDREYVWERNPWLVTQGLQRHLLQVGYVDFLLGRLLEVLKEQGLYQRALIIVTADHGASFISGGNRRRVDPTNVADIGSVPLFVKYPQQASGVRDSRSARTIDILPTIADVVGAHLPWPVDGTSLRQATPDRRYVIVGRNEGTPVRASLARVRQLRANTVRWRAARFGEGDDSLYRIGRAQNLLGLKIEPEAMDRSTISVRLENPHWMLNVHKASPYIPSRISGWLHKGTLPSGTEIAVAVNGRIAALTQAFQHRGRQRFRALVSPTALREGLNRVDVFAVQIRGHLVFLGPS
jgi:hypothetical protein